MQLSTTMPQKNQAYTSIYQFLWQVIKPYRWWYALMFQATIVTAFYFFMNNYAIKLVVDAFASDQVQYHELVRPITIFIIAQIALDVAWRFSEFALWHAEPFVHRSIMLKSYDYVQHHSYRYFQNHQSGTIISKLKGIVDGYDKILASLHYKMGKNFLTAMFCVFSLLIVNRTLFIFMLLWSILVIATLGPMSKKLNGLSNKVSDEKHLVMGRFSDNILNIFSLFYFAKRQQELKHSETLINEHYVPNLITSYRYFFKLTTVGSILYWLMLISVFLFLIWLKQHTMITTGDFVFVMMMSITISFELWQFVMELFDFMRYMGDFKSSFSILAEPHQPIDQPGATPYTIQSPSIQFQNLSFAYDAHTLIFNQLNFLIPAGQKIGLVGHSGAGKSTLISLLLKNFAPTTGHIIVDQHAINTITEDSLRSQIALIPQDILLFHRSIAENIGYAKENATLEDIKKAAKLANIDEYIESLPDQYDTLVGERGIKLSGGQRQRIAIARAILKQAPIIILDEATSSLDTLTEQQIQQSIHQLLAQQKTTVIAIAHRLSTIRHMDRIIVLENGHIIEDGPFDSLMAQNGYFKTLWDNQMNGMII